MSASYTSTDLQGMTAAQANFQNALDQVNTYYNNMSEQQATLAANWQGETSSAFGTALTQWLDDFRTVQSNLALILEKLSQNTGIYSNTNEESTQAAQMFSKGLSSVGGLGI